MINIIVGILVVGTYLFTSYVIGRLVTKQKDEYGKNICVGIIIPMLMGWFLVIMYFIGEAILK